MVVIDMVTGSSLRFDDQTLRHGHSVCLLDVSETPNDLLSTVKAGKTTSQASSFTVQVRTGQVIRSPLINLDNPHLQGCQLASLVAAKEITAAAAAVSSELNGIFFDSCWRSDTATMLCPSHQQDALSCS